MILKKQPSTTTKFLASHIRKARRSKPESLLICLICLLICLIIISEYLSNTGKQHEEEEKQHSIKLATKIEPKILVPPSHLNQLDPPKLEIFLQRVRNALFPFTKRYVDEVGPIAPLVPADVVTKVSCGIYWSSKRDSFSFPPCTFRWCTETYTTLKEAKMTCEKFEVECGGVTQNGEGFFQPRPKVEKELIKSSSERSWKMFPDACKNVQRKTAHSELVWEVFHDAVDAALEDDNLNLMKTLYPTREDGSIFISIAAYRDHTCKDTLRKAFERAKYPDMLSAGIVQQNCNSPDKCMTGTGWANTRQWVKSKGPDPDCAKDFCESELGRKHCEEGRVRILRLDEIDALGPFFTRFVNSKLWRGENYYMQIDAHTDFRSDWDFSLTSQMLATKSYPNSVISNYPISGSPTDRKAWPALPNPTVPDYGVPSCLCGCSFETAGESHYTVRLSHTGRSYSNDLGKPRRSLFVAAGFFIAHGSFVDKVGFDPFLPFLFMGEEIALSIRFYSNGYDIYGPSADVLRHEYVRKESPKFWETIDHVYSRGNLHNELSDMIVQRVQFLVKFPEADSESKVSPSNLLTRMDKFGIGKVRTIEQFLMIAEMDLVAKTQKIPHWCLLGQEPPGEAPENPKSPGETTVVNKRKPKSKIDVDVDLLH